MRAAGALARVASNAGLGTALQLRFRMPTPKTTGALFGLLGAKAVTTVRTGCSTMEPTGLWISVWAVRMKHPDLGEPHRAPGFRHKILDCFNAVPLDCEGAQLLGFLVLQLRKLRDVNTAPFAKNTAIRPFIA
jgi:hypothetical protein